MKVIHIIENLDKGAVENWLVSVFIESRKYNPNIEWTFFCVLGRPGRLDNIVIENGGKIIYSPYELIEKFKFLKYLRKVLKEGRYDILHNHQDYLSGFYLLASIGIKYKYRILQLHNNVVALPTARKFIGKILLKFFWRVNLIMNDKIVGIAEDTVDFFLRKKCPEKRRVLYYGFEFSKFYNSGETDVRKSLGLESGAILLLYVGKLEPLKNPSFLVDILKYMAGPDKSVHALFIGEGFVSEEIIEKAKEYGLTDNVHLLGWRDDVAQIMKQADIFIFPRVEFEKEGLGKVVVEAQAAGMRVLISNGIPKDAIVIDELVSVVSLKDNPEEWASAATRLLNNERVSRDQALKKLEDSKFSLRNGSLNLLRLYE